MSTIPADPHESAYALFDRWLSQWQREQHPPAFGAEPAAAAAPPTQEAGTSPMPASPAAAAPSPRRSPESEDVGLQVLQALTERAVSAIDQAAPSMRTERQVGGAILRFPGRPAPAAVADDTLGGPARPPFRPRSGSRRWSHRPSTSGRIEFVPRAGLRPVLTAGAVLGAALTALWVLVALLLPTSTTLGVAAGLAVLTGLLWSARMRATGTAVTIEDGVLRIVRGSSQHQFPLTGVHPPIDVLGETGDRAGRC